MNFLHIVVYLYMASSSRAQSTVVFSECDDSFECFAAAPCISGTKTILSEVLSETKVTATCSAFLKTHSYNANKATIVLESLDPTVTALILLPRTQDPAVISYKCEADRTAGTYKAVELLSNGKIIIKMEEPLTSVSSPLKCSFTATSKDLEVFGDVGPRSLLKVQKGTVEKVYDGKVHFEIKCDQNLLVFKRKKEEQDKVYRKYNFKLGKLTCDDDNVFHSEFSSPTSESFQKISSFDCKDKRFIINGKKERSEVIARCVADASYGCDYDVRHAQGQNKLQFVPPDIKAAKKGSLKCPTSHKYLVIGNSKPSEKEITCKNHGRGVMKWTTADGRILTESGPEVYCTDKLSCEPVSSLSVTSGFLKQSLPACYEEGKMSISSGSETFDGYNFEFKCDTSDGQNKFNTTEGMKIITNTTKFTCSYPNKAAARSAEKIGTALTILLVCLCIVIFASILGLIVWCVLKFKSKIKKDLATKLKTKNEEQMEYKQFIHDRNKKKEEDKMKKRTKSSSDIEKTKQSSETLRVANLNETNTDSNMQSQLTPKKEVIRFASEELRLSKLNNTIDILLENEDVIFPSPSVSSNKAYNRKQYKLCKKFEDRRKEYIISQSSEKEKVQKVQGKKKN